MNCIKTLKDYALLLLIICTALKVSAEEIVIYKDSNVKVTFSYYEEAHAGIADWLKLDIENIGSRTVQIDKLKCSLDGVITDENGRETLETSFLGKSDKYGLASFFHSKKSPSKYKNDLYILPGKTLSSYRFISSYAAANLQRVSHEGEFCAVLAFDFVYKLNGNESDKISKEEPFCFNWTAVENASKKKIAQQLSHVILNPSHQWIYNSYINTYSRFPEVTSYIPDTVFIDGVIKRKDINIHSERLSLLRVLKEREAFDHPKLVKHYRRAMSNRDLQIEKDLKLYWSNELFDDMLNFKLFIKNKLKIFEIHNESWSSSQEYKDKLFNLIQSHLKLDLTYHPEQEGFQEWYNNIKWLCISRHDKVIEYLRPLIKDETFLKVEDWSQADKRRVIRNNDKIDYIYFRVCDVAFVGLLRCLDEIKVNTEFDKNNRLKHNLFIDFKWRESNLENIDGLRITNPYTLFDLTLKYAEKHYYLNYTMKKELLMTLHTRE